MSSGTHPGPGCSCDQCEPPPLPLNDEERELSLELGCRERLMQTVDGARAVGVLDAWEFRIATLTADLAQCQRDLAACAEQRNAEKAARQAAEKDAHHYAERAEAWELGCSEAKAYWHGEQRAHEQTRAELETSRQILKEAAESCDFHRWRSEAAESALVSAQGALRQCDYHLQTHGMPADGQLRVRIAALLSTTPTPAPVASPCDETEYKDLTARLAESERARARETAEFGRLYGEQDKSRAEAYQRIEELNQRVNVLSHNLSESRLTLEAKHVALSESERAHGETRAEARELLARCADERAAHERTRAELERLRRVVQGHADAERRYLSDLATAQARVAELEGYVRTEDFALANAQTRETEWMNRTHEEKQRRKTAESALASVRKRARDWCENGVGGIQSCGYALEHLLSTTPAPAPVADMVESADGTMSYRLQTAPVAPLPCAECEQLRKRVERLRDYSNLKDLSEDAPRARQTIAALRAKLERVEALIADSLHERHGPGGCGIYAYSLREALRD